MMKQMKNIMYWDFDAPRIEMIRNVLGSRYCVRIYPSVEELDRCLRLDPASAVILGWKSAFGTSFFDRFRCRGPEPSYPMVILSDSEQGPCGVHHRHFHPLPPSRHHSIAEVMAKLLGETEPEKDGSTIFNGTSKAMRDVSAALRRYADYSCPVLILGETGTGKELAANALHSLSTRKSSPFVALNCAAIPESLVESELFGVERGAYTDAIARKGAFARAEGGTLFLDEIGSMASSVQPKLLRALEHGTYLKLGADTPEKSNFRLVAATCEDILSPAGKGLVRSDLFFRIADLIIRIPPLRHRKEDIAPLAEHFCHVASQGLCELSDSALARLVEHDWPGNVRELRSVINRVCADVAYGKIEAEDLVFISFFAA
jgi:DNA-binding NtrC family response regulator